MHGCIRKGKIHVRMYTHMYVLIGQRQRMRSHLISKMQPTHTFPGMQTMDPSMKQ